MPPKNLARMIQLAEESFAMRSDPTQLAVNEATMEKLALLHPDTLAEEATADGPVAWGLVIPTTGDLMKNFLEKKTNERELFERTLPGMNFTAIYLCSALVLPEYRRKGLAKKLLSASVRAIQKDHQINELFYWAFSPEGRMLAESIAKELKIPLRERK